MASTKKIKKNTRKSNKSELNLNVINQANEEQFTIKKITIPVNGVDYEVEVSQVFRTTKIEKMVTNFLKSGNIKEIEKLNDGSKINYFIFLIIKEFTNLNIPDNLKFTEELNLINNLIDLDIFSAIMAEIPENQIKKVNEFMHKFNMNLDEVIKEKNTKNIKNIQSVDNIISDDDTIINEDTVISDDNELSGQDGE